MTTRFSRYPIILLMVCFCCQAKAQCPTVAEVLENVIIIQGKSDTTIPEKIKQLQQLRELYLKCYNIKDSVYARITHRLGDMYNKANDLQKAINYTREAVAINSANNSRAERSFLANSYLNLGVFYKSSYLVNESLNCLDSCIYISTQFPDKYFIAFKAFDQKTYSFFQRGDYQKSMEMADNAILFAKKINDTLNEASPLSQKAQAQIQLNDIRGAERNIQRSICILETNHADTTRLATSYSIYASLLHKKGNAKAAIQYYRKSFDLNEKKGNWLQCAKDMSDLGSLYDTDLRDDANAIACYKRGIKMLDKQNDAYQLTALYINMGVVYWRKSNYREALGFYQKALNVLPIQFNDTSIKANPSIVMLKLVANDYFISTLLSNKGEALLDQYKNS